MKFDIWHRSLTAALAVIASIAILVVVAVVIWIPTKRDDVLFELAKASFQLLIVIILGGLVSLVFRNIDASRDQRRTRDELRFEALQKMVETYHDLKAVRRNLRFAGLRDYSGPLRCEQVDALRKGMETILKVHLAVEQFLRELSTRTIFDSNDQINTQLQLLNVYVEEIVSEWEAKGGLFWRDTPDSRVTDLPKLQELLGPAKNSFRWRAATPLGHVQLTIRAELVGETYVVPEEDRTGPVPASN